MSMIWLFTAKLVVRKLRRWSIVFVLIVSGRDSVSIGTSLLYISATTYLVKLVETFAVSSQSLNATTRPLTSELLSSEKDPKGWPSKELWTS